MGILIAFGGLIGAAVGLLAGGVFGFLKAKKKDANKFAWTAGGMFCGALVLGAAGFGTALLIVASQTS